MTMGRAVLFAAAAALAFASVAEAAPRKRKVDARVDTPRGQIVGQSHVERGRGYRTREAVVTGPNGGSGSVSAAQNWGRNDQGAFYHSERARSFPNGSSSSHVVDKQVDRDAGTLTTAKDHVFRDGTTRSVDSVVTKTGEGAYSLDRTVVGRNGETREQTGAFAVDKTESGRNVSGVVTTAKGDFAYDSAVSRGEEGWSRERSVTGPDGKVWTQSQSWTPDGEGPGGTYTGVRTNPDGTTAGKTVTRDFSDGTRTRSVDQTFRDGTSRSVDGVVTKTGDGTFVCDRVVVGRNGATREQSCDVTVTHE